MSVAAWLAKPHLSGSRHKEGTMTDEKKKPEEGEVNDKQLDDVAGGAMQRVVKKIVKPLASREEEEEEEIQT
jgi:hypothetical protein